MECLTPPEGTGAPTTSSLSSLVIVPPGSHVPSDHFVTVLCAISTNEICPLESGAYIVSSENGAYQIRRLMKHQVSSGFDD